jgi:hypothetical protein
MFVQGAQESINCLAKTPSLSFGIKWFLQLTDGGYNYNRSGRWQKGGRGDGGRRCRRCWIRVATPIPNTLTICLRANVVQSHGHQYTYPCPGERTLGRCQRSLVVSEAFVVFWWTPNQQISKLCPSLSDITGHISGANCLRHGNSNPLLIDGREIPLFID